MRTASESDRVTAAPEQDGPAGEQDLTLGEAASLYDISRSSLRRKLKAKKVPGAYQISGSQADEWRIPAASLEKLRVARREEEKATADAPAEKPGPEVGILSGYFIDAIKRERARRLQTEAEKIEADAGRSALLAESRKLKDALDDHRHALLAAQRSRAAAESQREAAQIRAGEAAARLRAEQERREEVEESSPTLPQTWGARVGWSFFGVTATLGALLLVASLFLDTLLFDRGFFGPSHDDPTGSSPEASAPPSGSPQMETPTASIAARGKGSAAARALDAGGDGRRSGTSIIGGTRRSRGRAAGRDSGGIEVSGVDSPRGPSNGGSVVGQPGGSGDEPGPAGGDAGTSSSGDTGIAAGPSEGPAGTNDCLCGAVGATAGTASGAAGTAVGSAGATAGSVGGTVGDAVQGAGNAVGGAVDGAVGSSGGTDSGVADAVGGAADAVGDAVGGAVPPLP